MPLTEDRLRQLIGAAADADLEAAVQQLVARAGPPSAPAAGSPAAPAPQALTGTPTPPAAAAPPAAPTPNVPAAVSAAGAPPPAAPAGTQAPPAAVPATAPAAPAAESTPPLPAGLPAGMVVISQGVLDQLQSAAALGVQAHQTLQAADDERVLAAALSEGRIAPADLADRVVNGVTVPGLRTTIRQAPAQVRAFLSALTPRFATSAIGADLGREVDAGVPDAALEAAWGQLEQALGADFGVAPAGGTPAQQQLGGGA